jgi:hypothetical protein
MAKATKYKRLKGRRATRRKRLKQRGGQQSFVSKNGIYISGEAFKKVCKYNLDDRYTIIPFDTNVQEGDRVFIKRNDIDDFINTPPSKKVILVVHNTDQTFTDDDMKKVRPYITKVYAVNSEAKDVTQIPLGFRDDQYTPHKVLDEVKTTTAATDRSILCLLNFSIHGDATSDRTQTFNAFKNKQWIKEDTNNTPGLHLDHANPETIRLRKDFYAALLKTKVVICPFGSGKDTHRVYEALFYGAIPVIKTSFLDPMYTTLGGCWIVKDWSEVTEDECNKRWNNRVSPILNTDVEWWLSQTKMTGGQNTAPIISFISYGNDNFRESKKRILQEANDMGCFNGQIKVYSPDDLSQDFKNKVGYVLNESRGGGYMTWKPFIINDMLSKVSDNEYILYADAGCTLQKSGLPRLYEYIKMIAPESGKSVLTMNLISNKSADYELHEKRWTSSAIFDYFNVPINSKIGNSEQILSGFILHRKCSESINMIQKWLDVAQTRADLFTDQYNNESKEKYPEFHENRHDQSIFSMIVKIKPYNNTVVIIPEEIEDATITKSPVIASRKKY